MIFVMASNDDSPHTSTQGSLTMVSRPIAITTDDKNMGKVHMRF